MLTLRAPIVEAQIPETYLLSAVTFQSLIATKAARCVEAAGGPRGGGVRHAPRAHARSRRAGRARRLHRRLRRHQQHPRRIPLRHPRHAAPRRTPGSCRSACETEAFRQLQRLLGEPPCSSSIPTTPLEGARRAAQLGRPLWGVRLDSGDFLALSRQVRAILDEAGLADAKIMVSGDLDEYRIRDLVRRRRAHRCLRRRHAARHFRRLPRPRAPSTRWWSWISAASSASPPSSAKTSRPARRQADLPRRGPRRDRALRRMRHAAKRCCGPSFSAAAWSSRCPRSSRPAARAAESLAKLPARSATIGSGRAVAGDPQPRTARADRAHPPQPCWDEHPLLRCRYAARFPLPRRRALRPRRRTHRAGPRAPQPLRRGSTASR